MTEDTARDELASAVAEALADAGAIYDTTGPAAAIMAAADDYAAERTAAAERELTAVTDRYHRLLRDLSQTSRRMQAAAQRAAIDAAHAFGDQWAAHHVYNSEREIHALIYQAQQLALALSNVRKLVHAGELAQAANRADQWLKDHKPAVTFTSAPDRAMIIALREYITDAGRKLHGQQHAAWHERHKNDTGPARPCDCDGCELTRGMDAPPYTDPCDDPECSLAGAWHRRGDVSATLTHGVLTCSALGPEITGSWTSYAQHGSRFAEMDAQAGAARQLDTDDEEGLRS